MRIAVITQWYPPENVWVPQSLVNALRSGGNEVTVITGTPHYPSGNVLAGYSASNPRDEVIDGISILRVPEYPYRGTGVLGRLAGYVSFAVSSMVRTLLVARDFDAVVVYSSPATSALPAMALRILARVPFALQVQDIWPDSVVDSGFLKKSISLRTISTLLKVFISLSYKLSSKIIVISPSAKLLLMSRGVPEEKLEVLFNWAEDPLATDRTTPAGHQSLRNTIGVGNATRVFFYAGAMGPAQDLTSIVSGFAAARLDDRACLVLVGSGVEFNKLRDLSEEAERVYVLDAVPLVTAQRWTAESDVGIVSLANTPLNRSTFPSKIQLLTGMGLPLLVRAPGDTSALTEKTGSGVGVSSFDLASLASAFQTMTDMPQNELDQMGRSARLWYEQSFNPARASTSLNRILSELRHTDPRG